MSYFFAKFLQIHSLRVPYVFWTEGNKEFLVISSDSFQIVDEGMKKKFIGLVMGDFSTQMYVERHNLKNYVLDLVMGGKPPQM